MQRSRLLPRRRRGRRVATAATVTTGLVVAGVLATLATTGPEADDVDTVDAAADALQDCGAGSYQAEVVQDGDTWTASNGGEPVYSGDDMLAATRAAVDSLTPDRTSQEGVVVRGSDTMDADQSLDLPSHTLLEVCGTIDVTGTPGGNHAVVRARGVTDVSVPHLSVTGTPYFGVFVRDSSDVHLGQIDLRLSGGLGVRIDDHGDADVPTRDISIDDVYVSGAGNHGVETYGVDGVTIGSVTARDISGGSGLLLNDTTNAEIGRVDGENVDTGGGYATFRMANRNGRVGDDYPANVHVGEVVARGGGRGVFCVSESGGAVIDRVDIAETTNNAILIENCHNVTIGTEGGTVAGPGEIRLAARDEFANNSDITIEGLTVVDSGITESPCGTSTNLTNNEMVNSSLDVC